MQLHLRSLKLPFVKRVRNFGLLFDATSIGREVAMSEVPATSKIIRRIEPTFPPQNTLENYRRPTDEQWASMMTELQKLAFVKFKLHGKISKNFVRCSS